MPRLLDLFCGAGGAAKGYHEAGFDVVGVDIAPQPNYPYEFHQADAMTYPLGGFDAIHASPPCQAYSSLRHTHPTLDYPALYDAVRARLVGTGRPWVIENVIGAPYRSGFVLCGSMFGMQVRRHRNFEASFAVLAPPCDHRTQGTPLGVYGHGGENKKGRGTKARPSQYGALMGMPWATPREITQAVPPAYTAWIGTQLLDCLEVAACAGDPIRFVAKVVDAGGGYVTLMVRRDTMRYPREGSYDMRSPYGRPCGYDAAGRPMIHTEEEANPDA